MKQIYFLAGLPRSGSTLLAAILNQNPLIHASSTSGLLDTMVGTLRAWHDSMNTHAQVDREASEAEIKRILNNITQTKYEHVSKPIILDKARGWASDVNMRTMAKVFDRKPKIIATVRDIPSCAASFVRIAKPDSIDEFVKGELIHHLKESYQTLLTGYMFAPECFLFVDYDDLLTNPQKELTRVHNFLGIEDYQGYNLDAIDGSNLQERDEEVWLVKGLHDVKPKLAHQHGDDIKDLLKHRYNEFVQPKFWLGEQNVDRPVHDLDLQLKAGLVGDFEEGWRLAEKIEKEEPWNNRAAFNRGWYYLWKGHLLEGEKLLQRGREEEVFGNPKPKVPTEMWDGKSKGTVLLNLEAGLGDQIHGARWVREIVKRGSDAIVACSGQLALLFRDMPGVRAVIQHEAVFGVVHDYWLPSMSAVPVLGLEYKDVDGSPYITKPAVPKNKKFRIGVRWQGNPQFEHEQHRIFPPYLLFNAIKGLDVEYISLQRDEGSQFKPVWIDPVPLNTWIDTQNAIASCDMVITSCTSIGHLAGAMGIPTWIIVPILPYYLWAPPGDDTKWYDSVRLFRQEQYGNWESIFNKLKEELKREI